MKIDLYIPPAIDEDLGNTSGWLVRCKPENDCASLFSADSTLVMFPSTDEAMAALAEHLERFHCAADHALVAVANVESLVGPEDEVPQQGSHVFVETPLMTNSVNGPHPKTANCSDFCTPVVTSGKA